MSYLNRILPFPRVIEQIQHNLNCFVPHQVEVFLENRHQNPEN